jgi:uncharacterized protein YqgC (DUF456 family)
VTPLESTGLTLFIIVLIVGLFMTVFSLPGTVVIMIDVLLYALVTHFSQIGVGMLLLLAVITLVAEAADIALGMAGATTFGFSGRAVWAAVAAACLGAAMLTPFLLGLGVFLGVFLGGFVGLLATEIVRYGRVKQTFRPLPAAILGRVTAVFAKGGAALSMIIVTLLTIYS